MHKVKIQIKDYFSINLKRSYWNTTETLHRLVFYCMRLWLSGLFHKFGDVFLNGAISCNNLFISITPPNLPLSRGGISPPLFKEGLGEV